MTLGSKPIVSILIFLLANVNVKAQTGNPIPLLQILPDLEQKFDVVFTYLDSDLAHVTIEAPDESYDLDTVLAYLHRNTQLQFRKLSNRFIGISISDPTTFDLCGRITDAKTGEPLIGAVILSGDQITVGENEGLFNLKKLTSEDSITIRILGYETKTFGLSDLPSDSCHRFLLEQKITVLEQIVVTNYIARGINKRIGGSFEINTGLFNILPGLTEPDVLHSLQALPGIQSINETVSDINVRGGTNDQNLILWDQVRMYQPGHFFGLISAFNPYFTDKVVFIKNGTSAEHGDAVSSTINIKTDDQVASKISGAGGFNLINGDLLLKIPVSNKASLHLSGRRSFADVVRTPTFNQYFDRAFRDTDVLNVSSTLDGIEVENDFYFVDGSAKFLYDITKRDKLRISFLDIRNEIEYQENELLNGLVESRTSGLVQKSQVASILYSRLWGNKAKSSLLPYLSSYRLNSVNFDILKGQRLIQENEILDVGVKFDSRISVSNNLEILGGYQLSDLGITNVRDLNNPGFRSAIKEVLRTHAGFIEGTFNSTSGSTNARAGVRTTYFEKFSKLVIDPRFSFSQRLSDRLSFELLGEAKNQSTTQVIDFQTDFLGIEKRRWVLSNDNDIPILQSHQVSLGLTYNYDDLLVTLEGYQKKVSEIASSSQGFLNQFQFVNATGNYDAMGLDFLLNKKFHNVSSWLSYTIADNTFEFDGLVPPTFPNNLDVVHTITVGTNYKLNAFEFSSGLNFRTGKPFTKPDQEIQVLNREINYGLPNSSRIENYFRIDLSSKYNFKLRDGVLAQVGISVWNVLNRENIINTYFQLDQLGEVEQIEQRSLGLTPNFNFRITF
ncbi:MAG: TonB-dependent receptor plug domain-containing protein [Cyclobacteriaceae bacterium]